MEISMNRFRLDLFILIKQLVTPIKVSSNAHPLITLSLAVRVIRNIS